MQQLTVFAPALQVLNVRQCFAHRSTYKTYNTPVANISAPQLTTLNWNEPYDPSFTQFGNMENLRWLATYPLYVYGHDSHRLPNSFCLRLIRRFQLIQSLRLMLVYRLVSSFLCDHCVNLESKLRNVPYAYDWNSHFPFLAPKVSPSHLSYEMAFPFFCL
jgi:hypothetical protein